MRNLLLLAVFAISVFLAVSLTYERLQPQLKNTEDELRRVKLELLKLEQIHTKTIEECGEAWLKQPIEKSVLEKMK